VGRYLPWILVTLAFLAEFILLPEGTNSTRGEKSKKSDQEVLAVLEVLEAERSPEAFAAFGEALTSKSDRVRQVATSWLSKLLSIPGTIPRREVFRFRTATGIPRSVEVSKEFSRSSSKLQYWVMEADKVVDQGGWGMFWH
jgi:hypothetical protein